MDISRNNQAIQTAARLIKDARLAVFFTGAGISTPSGVPDFRGSTDSLWNTNNAMEVASLSIFHEHPERFFNWLYPLANQIVAAKPNPAHLAVAEMEKAGLVKAVITQNIDHLHQDAGSQNVLELHGSITTATCSACSHQFTMEEYLPDFLKTREIPRCSICGGVIKPDIVLFEELLPFETWSEAERLSQVCDLMVVAGSSLEVIPASTLPMNAVRTGAQLIIINRTPTQLDSMASVILSNDVVDVLPNIARILL
jgi:NAD-dependent deacetylase